MPPRRSTYSEEAQDAREPTMGDLSDLIRELQRDLQKMDNRLGTLEEYQRGIHNAPPSVDLRHEEEEENHSPRQLSSDEEPRPNRFGVTYQRRIPPPQHHDFGVKIDLPEYDGRMDPDEFVEWLQAIERIFEYKDVPPDRRVSLAAIRLKKSASLWWENLKRARRREGRSKIVTWEKMKRELQRKYLPAHYRQDLFLRLQHLQQRELSVEVYTTEFEQLMLKCDLTEPEEHTVARYLGGLRSAISNIVQLQPYWTLIDVQTLAFKVEKQQLAASKQISFGKPTPSREVNIREVQPPTTKPVSVEKGITSTTPRATKCFRCHGFGHIASNCPTRNLITFTEQGEAVEIQEKEEDKTQESTEEPEEVYHLHADEGELLVVRRSLTVEPIRDDQWLRHNIFRTRCTIKGKVCSLVIDGGSCENVASTKLVKKLSLPTQKHSQPYALTWLNQGNEVHVTKRCLINFSIGDSFQDQVWCDVVPMDACHILLGRPWQYDRRTEHDGHRNTYSFVKDGKHIVILPWREATNTETKEVALAQPAVFPTRHSCLIQQTIFESLPPQIDMVLGEKWSEPFPIPPRPLSEYLGSSNKSHQTTLSVSHRCYLLEHAPRRPLSPEQNHLVWVRVKKRKVSAESSSSLGLVVDELDVTFTKGDVSPTRGE